MSQVLSMRFRPGQAERLAKIARRLGRTPSETGALLIEEALRRSEFGGIDFRDSPVGRQAYVQGSSLAVWEVTFVARHYDLDPAQTAAHFDWPIFRAQAALNYAVAFPEEINVAIDDNAAFDFQTLSRMLPQVTSFSSPSQEP